MTASAKRPHPNNPRPARMDYRRRSHAKVCTKCKQEKDLGKFNIRDGSRRYKASNPSRYSTRCKECLRAKQPTDAAFGPDRRRGKPKARKTSQEKRDTAASYKRRVRRETRIKALHYLADKGCKMCGERDPRVLEFDHLRPCDKDDPIAKLLCDGYSWGSERLRVEIRKCRVLCANCHRLHTAKQLEYYAHKDVQSALRGIYERYDIRE